MRAEDDLMDEMQQRGVHQLHPQHDFGDPHADRGEDHHHQHGDRAGAAHGGVAVHDVGLGVGGRHAGHQQQDRGDHGERHGAAVGEHGAEPAQRRGEEGDDRGDDIGIDAAHAQQVAGVLADGAGDEDRHEGRPVDAEQPAEGGAGEADRSRHDGGVIARHAAHQLVDRRLDRLDAHAALRHLQAEAAQRMVEPVVDAVRRRPRSCG